VLRGGGGQESGLGRGCPNGSRSGRGLLGEVICTITKREEGISFMGKETVKIHMYWDRETIATGKKTKGNSVCQGRVGFGERGETIKKERRILLIPCVKGKPILEEGHPRPFKET